MNKGFFVRSAAGFLLGGWLTLYAQDTDVGIEIPAETEESVGVEIPSVEEVAQEEAPEEAPEEELVALPELQKFIEAKYPEDLLQQKVEGAVLMNLLVNEQGIVEEINVEKSIHPSLDTAALHAVKQFRFSPAQVKTSEGLQAVAVQIQYEYRFSVKDQVKVADVVNFAGALKEKGTRAIIPEGLVVLSPLEGSAKNNFLIPWEEYLKKLSDLDGQFAEGKSLVCLSDTLGQFSFKGLPAGEYVLSFPISGYQKAQSTVEVESGKRSDVEFTLRRESYDTYELVVYGKAEKKEVAKTTLQMQEITRVPGMGGDAIKVVRALPGVARQSMMESDIIMRGAGGEDNKFYLDGVELPYLFHFGGLKSVYHSDLLSQLDMLPGGFGVRYGGATGGVVELTGRKAKEDRWHGKIDVNFLDASVNFEGPVSDKLTLQTAGRYSYIGPVVEAATKDMPTAIVPYYWDGLVRADYQINKTDNVFYTFNAARDKVEIKTKAAVGGSEETGESTDKGMLDLMYGLNVIGYNARINEKAENELRFSYTAVQNKIDMFGYSDVTMNWDDFGFRDEIRYKVLPNMQMNIGTDILYSHVDYTLEIMGATGIKHTDVESSFSRYGAYVSTELEFFDKLTLIPGYRYDYFSLVDENAHAFRMNGRYEYLPGLTFKGAYGTYAQLPVPLGQATDGDWGNPDLPLTRAVHNVIGHEWEVNDLVSLDVQGYYNTQDRIAMFSDSLNPQTGEPVNFTPDMDGRMYGMELMLRHKLGNRFFGWISYSLSRSERKAPSAYLEGFDMNDEWDPNKWNLYEMDQTHNLQLVASWKLPRDWEAGFRFQYATGNPETPHLGIEDEKYVYNSEYLGYEEVMGEPMSGRVDPNVRLDIRVDKRFVFEKWMLSTYLDVANATYFWYNSPEFYEYNYDYSERKVVGGLFLPTLGVEAQF